jgi:excisionase family DNA binding protein
MEDTLLTAKQVRELLKVDRTTIYRMLKDGRLSGVKVGSHWRFYSKDVEDLFNGSRRIVDNNLPISSDILPLRCMQSVQDVFSEIAEIGAVTTNTDGQPLTRISNSCDFCKLILGSESGRSNCINSWRKLSERQDTPPEFITCHAGLQYARARIVVNETLIAMLVVGQFYITVPDSDEERGRIHKMAGLYSIGKDLLTQAARQIPILDKRKVSQLTNWVGAVAHTFEQISTERADLMSRLRQIAEMSVFENPIS